MDGWVDGDQLRRWEEDAWLIRQRRLAGLAVDPPGVVRLNRAWIRAHATRRAWLWARLTWRIRVYW